MEKLCDYRKFFAFMIFTMIVSGMLSLIPPVLLQIWSREEAALSLDKIIWVSVLLLMANLLNAFLIFIGRILQTDLIKKMHAHI